MADLWRALRPLRNQLTNLVARAVVSLADDSLKMQLLQLTIGEGETRDGAERFQQYGLTSVPLEGAEAVVLSVGGRRDHLLVVAVDDRRHRLKDLVAGEVALYTDEGAKVHLKRGRIVVEDSEIRLGSDSASNFVALATQTNQRLANLEAAFNAHVHATAATGPPVGPTPVPSLIPVETVFPGSGVVGSVAATKVKGE
jgi:phage baseplate assembly protein V